MKYLTTELFGNYRMFHRVEMTVTNAILKEEKLS